MDLSNWVHLMSYGLNLDVFGKDTKRVLVERDTGKALVRYEMLGRGVKAGTNNAGRQSYRMKNPY
ncbi:hypothetical protein ACFLTJ_02305 [Chloroflexota bacterium]